MKNYIKIGAICLLLVQACVPKLSTYNGKSGLLPEKYQNYKSTDTTSSAKMNWKNYFDDELLSGLIQEGLQNNQELNIFLQEIEVSKNEIKIRKGEYLPFVQGNLGLGLDKAGRYTRFGAVDEQLEIKPEKHFPNPFSDIKLGGIATWEIDVWKKLRNAKKSAMLRYLATVEGKNFLITNLVSEIAYDYYELLALDNHLEIINQNIEIQNNALQIVKQEKEFAKVSQLAVNRFEAQLLNTQNLQYEIKQRIVEAENRINFLLGRTPQPIKRNSKMFFDLNLNQVQAGIPSQLLSNRADIKQAEINIQAAKLDVKVAKANFYPSFKISADVGLQAFSPAVFVNLLSIFYSIAGEAVAPLVNRNAIKANYMNANAKQIQTLYVYEQTVLRSLIEVQNQLAKSENYSQSFVVKQKETDILTQSIGIASDLYRFARADYMEVLLTQREALNEKLELVEIKAKVLESKVGIYRALGGGWQ